MDIIHNLDVEFTTKIVFYTCNFISNDSQRNNPRQRSAVQTVPGIASQCIVFCFFFDWSGVLCLSSLDGVTLQQPVRADTTFTQCLSASVCSLGLIIFHYDTAPGPSKQFGFHGVTKTLLNDEE